MLGARLKAQSTLEYVILFGFVIAAIIAIGVYMRRGTEGKLRESADQVGEQYEAGCTTSNYTVATNLSQREVLSQGGHIETEITTNTQNRTGSETVSAL